MARKEPYTAARQKRNQRSYMKKVAEHRCVTCGKPDERTLSGRVYCQECYDRHKAGASPRKPRSAAQSEQEKQDKREWEARCKSLQMCVRCGEKDKYTVNGHRLCKRCSERKNQNQREHYDHEKMSSYYKSRRDAWRQQGLCTYCGGEKEEQNKMLCIDCRVKARMQRRKREADKQ